MRGSCQDSEDALGRKCGSRHTVRSCCNLYPRCARPAGPAGRPPSCVSRRVSEVACTYDDRAVEQFRMHGGENVHTFDCLIGCDGPHSVVRETQAKHFGDVEKRKFMDCVGIVANVRKLSRNRLKELGFPQGQQPGDMNRTKNVFKDFFQKIASEADADIESLIFYKADVGPLCEFRWLSGDCSRVLSWRAGLGTIPHVNGVWARKLSLDRVAFPIRSGSKVWSLARH